MNVVVVLAQPPLLEGGAPGRCAIALLRGLRAHGVEVSAIAARGQWAFNGSPPPDLPLEVVDVRPQNGGWRARVQMLRRPSGYLSRGPFGDRVRELSASADVLHLEETHTGWCDLGLSVPSLVHPHHLTRLDASLPPPWRKELFGASLSRLADRLAAVRHRYLVASSPIIAEQLRSLAPRAEIVLAPLSLDPTHYPSAALDGPPVAGIIGTGTWPPTAASILRLVSRVWPLVHREVPEATLRVAGRGVADLGLESGNGVEVVGEVDSAASFIRGLSLLLYPIERGSGMKVKVLEAIASGVPVVTTRFGAEGVEGGDGVVIERSDAELAAAAVSLLRDDVERRERGRAARVAFLERHAPEVATAPLVDLYHRMVARG
jgi:glycosyltransferase involved in cell wall biosynthesis